MDFYKLRIAAAVLPLFSSVILSQTSNLPPPPPGLFTVGTRLEISSTTSAAWRALTNFPDYASWNPFVREAIVVTPLNITVPEQYPVEGYNLYLRTQIPPLPLPVVSSTPDNPLHTAFAYENITHVQPDLLRVAWAYVTPPELLEAERWQAISDIGDGKILYESREVFAGALASTLRTLYGEGLQEAFDAQGQGLKLLLEA